MSSLKDIYWMASPLAIDQRNNFNGKHAKLMKPVARYIDPKNEIHVFRKIQHWTLEIDGKCYELSPNTKKKLNVIKRTTDMIKPRWIPAMQWREIRESRKIEPEKRKIGQTSKTHDEIWAEVKYIFTEFNADWYGLFTQNCQNFASMLFERVAVEIPNAEKGLWDRIPDPVGYRLAEGAQFALASKITYGTNAAYVGAVAKATSAAEAGQGLGAAGTMGATSGAAVSGGTAAVGGTTAGSTTAGGGAVTSGHVGFGAKVAGLMHGRHAGTIGSGAKIAGLMHSGHAAAIGSGAKAAALMHGGHAAVIGGGMAKAGAAAAFAHPVTGIAITGGLAYLAIRGKRGKDWNKKHKHPKDMDVFDLLVGEEKAVEQAENPDRDVTEELVADLDDSDQEIDENLAEELKLGLVTTEPGIMTEEHEAVPAVQDTRRAQTTI
ncbi:MAG: hypothetical protein Q9225_001489 [Loekoesia sp. 1 TL-2023]